MPLGLLTASRRLLLPLLLAGIALGASATASAAERTGRLLVTVDRSAPSRATPSVLHRVGARKDGAQIPELGVISVRPLAGETLAATAETLRKLPWVKSVGVDRVYKRRFIPNDPALSQQETAPGTPLGITKEWWAAKENLFSAWDVTRGSGAKVAIIDSGIDGNHPEFAGKIAATVDNDPDPTGPANVDIDGHGTHVASAACATGNNGAGIVGTGLNCSLIIVKTQLSDAYIIKSIVDATNLGADAINMSFGNTSGEPPPPQLIAALNYALSKDVVLVAAADNNFGGQEQGDPANLLQPTATGQNLGSNLGLSVTSADYSGLRSYFAGAGTQISLAGNGGYAGTGFAGPDGVIGALPANQTLTDTGVAGEFAPCGCRTSINGDGRYGYLNGTSMAAPKVAGIAALVKHLNPDLRSDEVVRILKETASRPSGSGWNPETGWGVVNAGAAVGVARRIDRRAPSSKARGPKSLRGRTSFTLRWSGKDSRKAGLLPSGVKTYQIYRSKNGGKFKRIFSTRKKKKTLKVKRGARYRYYTVAVDKRGNREKKPKQADVSFRVR